MLFTEEDLEKSYFEGTKIVVCQNEIPIETTRRALELGKEAGAQLEAFYLSKKAKYNS